MTDKHNTNWKDVYKRLVVKKEVHATLKQRAKEEGISLMKLADLLLSQPIIENPEESMNWKRKHDELKEDYIAYVLDVHGLLEE